MDNDLCERGNNQMWKSTVQYVCINNLLNLQNNYCIMIHTLNLIKNYINCDWRFWPYCPLPLLSNRAIVKLGKFHLPAAYSKMNVQTTNGNSLAFGWSLPTEIILLINTYFTMLWGNFWFILGYVHTEDNKLEGSHISRKTCLIIDQKNLLE